MPLSSRLFQLVFLGGLWVQPFIYGELHRVVFIQRWIEIVVILGLTSFLIRPKNRKIYLPTVTALGLFLSAGLVSAVINNTWGQSFWGNYWRGDGIFTLFHFTALALTIGLNRHLLKPKLILKTIGLGSLLISAWVLFDNYKLLGLNQAVPNWRGVVGVSFNQPVFLAGYLAVTLPAVMTLAGPVGPAVQALAIGFTRAWGGYLGILLFLSGRKARLASGLILLAMIGGLIFKTNYYLQSGMWVKNAEARERIVMKGILAWSQRPVFGWGWANFGQAWKAIDWPEKYNADIYVDKAHSTLLEILVTTGLIGLIGYVWLIKLMWPRIPGQTYLLMLILYIVHSQTNIISVSEELLFWIILGLSL